MAFLFKNISGIHSQSNNLVGFNGLTIFDYGAGQGGHSGYGNNYRKPKKQEDFPVQTTHAKPYKLQTV
jgi:hypothetical protein